MKKTKNEPRKFILSDEALCFIKKHVLGPMKISLPLCESDIWDIMEFVETEFELGCMNDSYDGPIAGKEELYYGGTKVVDEISGNCDNEPDMDYLNKRLNEIS